jgi:heme o synthase
MEVARVEAIPAPVVVEGVDAAEAPSRAADLLELTKPRITGLVLITAAVGYAVGSGASFEAARFLLFMAGTGLLCAGASALNQYLERDADARMRRTCRRPIPAGRIRPDEALVFGLALSAVGLAALAPVNALTLGLGALSLVSYVLAYTPLKRVTSLCTVVGAVPGALPPLMGWAAARGVLGPAGWGLFAILFLWQLPHFLAIGWLYRDDYARGGFPMLAVTDSDGSSTGRQALLYSAALLPVTLAAGLLAGAGNGYLWGALVMGAAFLVCAAAFAWRRSVGAARRLFFASVLYLPLLLGLMVFAR